MEKVLTIFGYILSVLLGVCVGSFLNVCIYRLPRGNFFSKARSFCPKCGTPIKAYDNIPILSYIILRGKCRACHEPISPRYPIIEALNMILWIVNFAVFGLTFDTIIYDILVSTLIVVAMIDIDVTEIPDSSIITIILLGLLTFIPVFDMNWKSKLIGAFCISVPMLIIAFFGGMGFGDVKLYFALGLLFGWEKMLIIFILSFVIGSIVGVANMLYIRHKGENKDDENGENIEVQNGEKNTIQPVNLQKDAQNSDFESENNIVDTAQNNVQNSAEIMANMTDNIALSDSKSNILENAQNMAKINENTAIDTLNTLNTTGNDTNSVVISQGVESKNPTICMPNFGISDLDNKGEEMEVSASTDAQNNAIDMENVKSSDEEVSESVSMDVQIKNDNCANNNIDNIGREIDPNAPTNESEDEKYERELEEKLASGKALPFGPSIVLATFITMYAGDAIINFYKELIGLL